MKADLTSESAIAATTENSVFDFLSWFRREYINRRRKNNQYSVRAFARYLGIAAPTVSHLLSGKRKPSAKFASSLIDQLNATPNERKAILSSLARAASPAEKSDPDSNADFRLIALDSFKLIADWQHYAIMEITAQSDFRFDYTWIAQQLEISVTEAREAVERLLRLDILVKKGGTLVKTNACVTNYVEGQTSSALKQLQRHVLQKALDAIDLVPAHEKDITSMTMAIDEKKLPEAKKRITRFRREMSRFLEAGEQTRVFNLGIQLYPISKGSKK